MALSQKAKQDKALKKQQKRKLKLKQKAINIQHIQKKLIPITMGEIHQCYISKPSSSCPFVHVIISRIDEDSNTILSIIFIINPHSGKIEDVYKEVDDVPSFYNFIDYNISVMNIPLTQTPPEIGKAYILQAEKHAKSLAISPHHDYSTLKQVFFDLDESFCNIQFHFE